MPGFDGPDVSGAEQSGQIFITNLAFAGAVLVANADGTATWTAQSGLTAGNATKIGGVTVTGTPTTGQQITATSATAADWAAA